MDKLTIKEQEVANYLSSILKGGIKVPIENKYKKEVRNKLIKEDIRKEE